MFGRIFHIAGHSRIAYRYFSGMYGVLRIKSVKVSALEAKYQARKGATTGSACEADFRNFH